MNGLFKINDFKKYCPVAQQGTVYAGCNPSNKANAYTITGACGTATNLCYACDTGYEWDGNSCEKIVTCQTSGTCTASSNICDNFWCSSGEVCQDFYVWNPTLKGGLGDCERASFCGDDCPYTPSQTQYFTTPGCFSGSYSCCQVNYGTPTTDWVKFEIINPS